MREPIYQCPNCNAHLREPGMAEVKDPEHGYCYNCEEIVHKPKQIGEHIHLYTKVEFPGLCDNLKSLAAGTSGFANRLRKLDENGFEIVQHIGDDHYYLENIEEPESEFKVDKSLK